MECDNQCYGPQYVDVRSVINDPKEVKGIGEGEHCIIKKWNSSKYLSDPKWRMTIKHQLVDLLEDWADKVDRVLGIAYDLILEYRIPISNQIQRYHECTILTEL